MASEGELSALLEEGLISTYIAAADAVKYEILRLAEYGSPHFPLLEHAYAKPIRKISAFRIRPLSDGAFKYDAESGIFTLNLNPVLALFGEVLDDVRRTDRSGIFVLDRDEIHQLLRRAFRLYLLHEIRHLAHGLADHASVGALKKIAGEQFLADLDLYADRDAAAAYAALEVYGESGDRRAYLEHFRDALFLAGQYSFRAFRFTADRPFKMARGIGLTLMAARLARIDLQRAELTTIEQASPLDGGIMVKVSPDYTSIVVVLSDPDTQVVNITCEVPDGKLKELADKIDKGDFLGALDVAAVLLSRMSLAG